MTAIISTVTIHYLDGSEEQIRDLSVSVGKTPSECLNDSYGCHFRNLNFDSLDFYFDGQYLPRITQDNITLICDHVDVYIKNYPNKNISTLTCDRENRNEEMVFEDLKHDTKNEYERLVIYYLHSLPLILKMEDCQKTLVI
jgi:hypothetical protein